MIRRLLSVAMLLLFCGGAAEGQFNDEFDADALETGWSWMREQPARWDLGNGQLKIFTERGALNGLLFNNVRNMLLQPLSIQGDFMMDTELRFTPEWAYRNAGLLYYIDDDNYIRVSRGIHEGRNTIWMEWEIDGVTTFEYLEAPLPLEKDDLAFRLRLIRRSGNVFTAAYQVRWDQGDWTGWDGVGTATIDFPSAAVRVGLQAANGDGIYTTALPAEAEFNWFHISTTTAVLPSAIPPEAFRISAIHPSPATPGQEITVQLVVDRRTEIRCRMTDLLGRDVSPARDPGALPSGTHRLVLPTGSLVPGVYFLHFTGNGTRSTRRILLTH
ncbi:MAG: hypothetical protein JXA28_08720 [Bacteroidetes bacterium]|nr:hypothetical protein [Bacteroidota bacterium]